MNNQIFVTIRCITYNHEPFIRQCLEGFIMQKTNFRFEAIVHDDASTDGTVEIVREYAAKYPDIIKPIIETENQYSKHDGSLSRIMNKHTHGKYVAICEGDDYWTDPYKLQKQVDFLESHPDYSMCFHNAIVRVENDVKSDKTLDVLQNKQFSNIINRDYVGVELYQQWIVPTASAVYRKEIIDSEFYRKAIGNSNLMYGDIVLFLSCAAMGKIRGFSDVMSVYRRHAGGVTMQNAVNEGSEYIRCLRKQTKHAIAIIETFGNEYKKAALEVIEPAAYFLLFKSKEHDGRFYKYIFIKYPIFTIYAALRRIKYNFVKPFRKVR